MLVTIVFILVITIGILLKIMYIMHLRIEATRDAMDWVRQQWRQSRDRRLIREEEQQRLGVWLESADEESFEEEGQGNEDQEDAPDRADGEDPTINGREVVAHIRRMTKEEFYSGAEEEMESENEEIEVEVNPPDVSAGAAGSTDGIGAVDAPAALASSEADLDFDWDSVCVHPNAFEPGDNDGYDEPMEEDPEEEEDDDVETNYGSMVDINEDLSVFEELEPREYDDYRFLLLGEGATSSGTTWAAETDMVEEWMAAHHGSGETETHGEPGDRDDDWSPSMGSPRVVGEGEDGEREGGDHEDPPVVTEEASSATDAHAGTSPPRATPKSSGKCGGKGHALENLREPPADDEADGHV
eukprot:s1353_g24.t1